MDINTFIKTRLVNVEKNNIAQVQEILWLSTTEQVPLPNWLEIKINKKARELDMTMSEIITAGIVDKLAASALSKKANRQNVPEKLQIEYLKHIRKFNIEKLPTTGSGSIRIDQGKLISNTMRCSLTASKTIDCVCEKDFISLKYLDVSGGAQDNQIMDIKDFLKNAIEYTKHNEDDTTFTAILDGLYGESRIKKLVHLTSNRVRVCNSDTYVQ